MSDKTVARNILAYAGPPSASWMPDRTLELLGEGIIDPRSAAAMLNEAKDGFAAMLVDELRTERAIANIHRACGFFGPVGMAVAYAVEGVWRLGAYLYDEYPAVAAAWDTMCSWLQAQGEKIWETLSSWWDTVVQWFEGAFADATEGLSEIAQAASGALEDYAAAQGMSVAELAAASGLDEGGLRRAWDKAEAEALAERQRKAQEKADAAHAEAEATAGEEEEDSDSGAEWGDTETWDDPDWDEFGFNEGYSEQDWAGFWERHGEGWLDE